LSDTMSHFFFCPIFITDSRESSSEEIFCLAYSVSNLWIHESLTEKSSLGRGSKACCFSLGSFEISSPFPCYICSYNDEFDFLFRISPLQSFLKCIYRCWTTLTSLLSHKLTNSSWRLHFDVWSSRTTRCVW
jgi:hypothetical protein